MKIYLLRHFHTDAAEADVYCSRTDMSLNNKGLNLASKLVKLQFNNIFPTTFTHIYCSERTRTIQSIGCLSFAYENITKTPLLNEIDHGDFEGLTKAQVKEKWPEFNAKDLDFIPYPNGESINNVVSRVNNFIDLLEDTYKENDHVLVVSHKTTCKVITAIFLDDCLNDLTYRARESFDYSPGGLTEIELTKDSRPRLIRFNDTSWQLL